MSLFPQFGFISLRLFFGKYCRYSFLCRAVSRILHVVQFLFLAVLIPPSAGSFLKLVFEVFPLSPEFGSVLGCFSLIGLNSRFNARVCVSWPLLETHFHLKNQRPPATDIPGYLIEISAGPFCRGAMPPPMLEVTISGSALHVHLPRNV